MNFTDEEIKTCSATKGDLLVCEGGAGYGRSAIWDKDYDICLQNHVHRLRPFIDGICEYVYYFIYLLKESNQLSSVGTAMPGLSANRLKGLLLPLPPYNEQCRIVTKIKEIIPYVEQYGKTQDSLTMLTHELPVLLKKSILQEAIQGKLVPQNPQDESASVLLQQIKEEQLRLVREGKLKKKDIVNSIIYRGDDNKYWEKRGKEVVCIDDEIPFDLPIGWVWTRVKSILHVWSARRVHEKDWRKSGIPFYRAREIARLAEYDQVQNELFIDKSLYDDFSSSGVPDAGDIMMTAVGTLGKVYIVKPGEVFYFKDGSVLCLSNPFNLNSEYLKMVIESPAFVNQYIGESQGTTVATLTMVRVNEYLIPLPPLAEQSRIVDAINNAWQVL